MKQPHFFTMLTQGEWKMLFSVIFVSISDYFKDSYPIADYPSPGFEGPTKDWVELFLRAARYLGLKHGYHFEGIAVRDTGSVGGRVVEPGNENYVDLLRGGGLPNIPLALDTAINMLLSFDSTFDVGPLKAALAQVYDDLNRIDDWANEADPEHDYFDHVNEMRGNAYNEAMHILGLTPKKEILH